MSKVVWFTMVAVWLFSSIAVAQPSVTVDTRPNILWLSVEDMGPHLGCYGDTLAKTPNLDALAQRGMVFDVAWSNYPVCAPARTTLITGRYAASMAAGHMRCQVSMEPERKMFPQRLRESGYYCTNNAKEDYNVRKPGQVWDQSSRKASYQNRATDQPFFAVVNYTGTHESKIRKRPHPLVTDPNSVQVPPYHPDLPEVRRDWAQYYDNIATMDDWVGRQLKQLDESGLSHNTIIVFFSDHGSGMPRHKRFAGDSGMRVPLIVYVPERLHPWAKEYRAKARSQRPVGFVDFAPTMLSLAGAKSIEGMEGNAFMGPLTTPSPKYVFGFRSRMDERVDCSRSVRDHRYVYIRNYMPHLPHGQYIGYQQQTPTTAIWNQMFDEGKLNEIQSYFWGPKDPEELYDLERDPHETVNLARGLEASLPDSTREVLQRFRDALDTKQRQMDFEMYPEPMTSDRVDGAFDAQITRAALGPVIRTARDASGTNRSDRKNAEHFLALLETKGQDAAVRHWASVGLLVRSRETMAQHSDRVKQLLTDRQPTVRINAAEIVATEGNPEDLELALGVLLEAADQSKTNYASAIWSLNAIARLKERAEPILPKLKTLPRLHPELKRGGDYVKRLLIDLDQ